MRILITGSKGQLGYELLRSRPEGAEICAVDVDELDITSAGQVRELVDEFQPQLIVNAAAYTAVDRAESEPETVRGVNARGAENLARAATSSGARMIHISTDFVFDGSRGKPWKPGDPTAPLGVYGATKLEGEKAVQRALGRDSLILRTSWLYSAHGNNFVKTMLKLMREKDDLGVVADQVGSPTWAKTLADAVWAAARKPEVAGILHWSDAGAASWYDFAVAIQEEGIRSGLLNRRIPIRPIPTRSYPTPARRPFYSVLDSYASWEALDLEPLHWREALRCMLEELAESERE